MKLTKLLVEHFRNLTTQTFIPHPELNFLVGENGSGKTSVLESIYFLAHLKSFRTTQAQHCIKKNTRSLQLVTHLAGNKQESILGIERTENGKKVRLNQEPVKSNAKLAKLLPIQLISVESARIFCEGPRSRRQFIDWGLFHVKPNFHDTWKNFQTVLKQRNSAIKAKLSPSHVNAWNQPLCEQAEKLSQMRRTYTQETQEHFIRMASSFLPEIPLEIKYQQGWKEDTPLHQALAQNIDRDYQLSYTQLGPQRADLEITTNGLVIHNYLSQGQEKIISYALRIAQAEHLKKNTNINPIFLIDDLPSELDEKNRLHLANILLSNENQSFITSITESDLDTFFSLAKQQQRDFKVFHVKHGEIIEKSNTP